MSVCVFAVTSAMSCFVSFNPVGRFITDPIFFLLEEATGTAAGVIGVHVLALSVLK